MKNPNPNTRKKKCECLCHSLKEIRPCNNCGQPTQQQLDENIETFSGWGTRNNLAKGDKN